ncbi:MAG: hypothetical protein F6K25_23460 [Okeania sp. SIO2G4]|uniref:hypothetical protein n=1 Tax=unclassified Okeania TaxID=2634635 RepID=UPI0013B62AC5|nr:MULTISPECIES: hypothetical protein [unclassified Okeania]NEP07352.1 hypothetical protein [Okeania sp. SIO4D6]NEP39965.1 hypothetical protein [Okeania sp. SIO2H7]NEP74591.1 hypothetical protein [Okeania sp. SIO2G5]NEP95652.1 hypothetical protein [Okeania sp. SIO2F5]NEQ93464.1 hypothetical protein [Okeania sp. SIO2G4]
MKKHSFEGRSKKEEGRSKKEGKGKLEGVKLEVKSYQLEGIRDIIYQEEVIIGKVRN